MGKIYQNVDNTQVVFSVDEIIMQKALVKLPNAKHLWIDYNFNMMARAA